MRLLFIDDDNIIQLVNSHLAQRLSEAVSVDLMYDTDEILKYNTSESTLFYDFVFIDINMPKLSGFELLEKIFSSPNNKFQSSEIYMLTSSADKRDIEKAEKLHYVKGFLSKPLNIEILEKIIASK
jgi:CheY-like chemotaxis protein